MPTKTINVHEGQTDLKELLSQVREGAEIIFIEGDIPLARLVPMTEPLEPRTAGLHDGAIWTSDDFDEPLPEAFWLGNA